eukprot:CAMPEP_0184486278 /NCGR_PEP_ID=MMETSP0113_2-20130426/7793_1 /TAXON_ID=91329 /ORGANISM="Norrisiella sphaerica, Strain BC52" /LENGTH=286 /DNA_ID=CAMNT_0026868073 /DNA_START=1 /DNA_END=858 /DNA_ORIENTATION=+
MECFSCGQAFCMSHIPCQKHKCRGYKANLRPPLIYPMCPICGVAIPIRRGENPNARVDRHIQLGCPKPFELTVKIHSPDKKQRMDGVRDKHDEKLPMVVNKATAAAASLIGDGLSSSSGGVPEDLLSTPVNTGDIDANTKVWDEASKLMAEMGELFATPSSPPSSYPPVLSESRPTPKFATNANADIADNTGGNGLTTVGNTKSQDEILFPDIPLAPSLSLSDNNVNSKPKLHSNPNAHPNGNATLRREEGPGSSSLAAQAERTKRILSRFLLSKNKNTMEGNTNV